jgi:hypothetical protein
VPLQIPTLDDRTYQDLLNEALARIPVHNPEWTNFNQSDPGVTLLELFAFLTENLLYRSNRIPERNRLKFLSLLGVPLRPASSARGLVTFANERGPLQTFTLDGGVEVRAGQIPFRTEQSLDVLPVEGQVYYKRQVANPPDQLKQYYAQLYASFVGQPPAAQPLLYEAVPLAPRDANGIDLGQDTVDGALWIALLVRAGDKPADNTARARDALKEEVRKQLAGRTLSLGVVPALGDASRVLSPGGQASPQDEPLLTVQLPRVPPGGALPLDPAQRVPAYQTLPTSYAEDVLAQPGLVQITLPGAAELTSWTNLDPLEAGVGDFPPALDDTNLNDRVLTWLRVTPRLNLASGAPAKVPVRLLWVGINATHVRQRAHVAGELLPAGTGEPDQAVVLTRTPVIPDSVSLTVTVNGNTETWEEIDDLLNAGPEVPAPDPRQPPGVPPVKNPRVKVFTVDAESGRIQFGDGSRGARPPFGAVLRADYDYGVGRAGNVGAGSIDSSPVLPAGVKVTNPVRTWGGAEAETAADGEKQIARYLQHRDRLVTAADFATITWRTPGVDLGRVEIIPAYSPELPQNVPGDAPGAVTVLVIPSYDPVQPDAPVPDRLFLDTVCSYLDPRRLVTTELFLRGPVYKPIRLSVGIKAVAGSAAQVTEAVRQALSDYLSPLPQAPGQPGGWPLRTPVVALELATVAGRVPGVVAVQNVLLAQEPLDAAPQVGMTGLELPRVVGISVVVGDPISLNDLRGTAAAAGQGQGQGQGGTPGLPVFVPVPVIPEGC